MVGYRGVEPLCEAYQASVLNRWTNSPLLNFSYLFLCFSSGAFSILFSIVLLIQIRMITAAAITRTTFTFSKSWANSELYVSVVSHISPQTRFYILRVLVRLFLLRNQNICWIVLSGKGLCLLLRGNRACKTRYIRAHIHRGSLDPLYN